MIDEHRPQVVLSVGPDGLTGHPDHIAMYDAVAAALQLPGWSAQYAWGAMVLDADVRAADALIARHTSRVGSRAGHENLLGVPASRIEQTITSERGGVARKRAMDLYPDGLGSSPIDDLVHTLQLRGASLILPGVFDGACWGTERYTRI